MTAKELADRARGEAHELGESPDNPTDRPIWMEERRGVTALLAALANNDQALLRQAAMVLPADDASAARDLLLDSADSWHIQRAFHQPGPREH